MPEPSARSTADHYSSGVESGRAVVQQLRPQRREHGAIPALIEDLDDAERAVAFVRGQLAGARAELARDREGGEDCPPRDDTGAARCGEEDAAKTVGQGADRCTGAPRPADGAATPAPPPSHRLDDAVYALREAAAQARWNITHCEGVPEPPLEFMRHWRATAVWLEKRADALDHGDTPDRGWRPDEPAAETPEAPGGRPRAIAIITAELAECFPTSISAADHRNIAIAALNGLSDYPDVLAALAARAGGPSDEQVRARA